MNTTTSTTVLGVVGVSERGAGDEDTGFNSIATDENGDFVYVKSYEAMKAEDPDGNLKVATVPIAHEEPIAFIAMVEELKGLGLEVRGIVMNPDPGTLFAAVSLGERAGLIGYMFLCEPWKLDLPDDHKPVQYEDALATQAENFAWIMKEFPKLNFHVEFLISDEQEHF